MGLSKEKESGSHKIKRLEKTVETLEKVMETLTDEKKDYVKRIMDLKEELIAYIV